MLKAKMSGPDQHATHDHDHVHGDETAAPGLNVVALDARALNLRAW